MRWPIYILLSLSISSFSVSAQEDQEKDFNFKWNNGFKLESADRSFILNFGGRVFVDYSYLYNSEGRHENHVFFPNKGILDIKSAQLYFSGAIYENINFKVQVDFAHETVSAKDVYIGVSDIPLLGNFRIGHFPEPFRLANLTSSKYLTFMNRGAPLYFSQKRNNGVMIFNDYLEQRVSVQLGIFQNASSMNSKIDCGDGYAFTGRVTGIPYVNRNKDQLLYLGVGYSFRKPNSHVYKIPVPPDFSSGEHLIDGMIQNVRYLYLMNFETAYVHGPVSFQAEYLLSNVDTPADHFQFSNYYGELSWFLTGEHKNFTSSYEGLGRVKPKANFGWNQNGIGAWEVALRYSQSNISDSIIGDGKQSEVLLGLNWYLNPVTRLMINHSWSQGVYGQDSNLLQARFQVDF